MIGLKKWKVWNKKQHLYYNIPYLFLQKNLYKLILLVFLFICFFEENFTRFIQINFNFSGKPSGYDRVRNMEIGNKDFELETLEEAYTTEHWLVRIYKVKDLKNRGI